MNANSSLAETEPVSLGRLAWVVPLATAVAVTANLIFYFIITRWLHIGFRFPAEAPGRILSATLPAGDIVLFSVIFSLGAGIVFVVVDAIGTATYPYTLNHRDRCFARFIPTAAQNTFTTRGHD